MIVRPAAWRQTTAPRIRPADPAGRARRADPVSLPLRGAPVRLQAVPAPSPARGRLDWCCIGAQKAGTSTLYRLLRDHPQIAIPPSKEDPIFDAEVSAEQVRAYLDERFADAGDARCGTVTPQYMSAPDTAERMHRFVPDTKIVVLLRDPIERAYSHFRMSTLRELETRSFAAAVADQLATLEAGREIDLYSETDSYVVRGNYAWLLRGWFDRYGAERMLVVFNDDLDRDTAATIERVQRFLDVDVVAPPETEFRYNASPPPHRLSAWRKPVANALRRAGWDRIDPERRERISSRVERTLARALPVAPRGVPAETARRLRDYYAAGNDALAELVGAPLPWLAAADGAA
jgi:hypothetical protein